MSWYSRILSAGPPVNALRTHTCICVCVYVCLCLYVYLHVHTTAYDMSRRWGAFLVLTHFIFGPGRKRLAHSCICVCQYVCLCLYGYLHMHAVQALRTHLSCLSVCVFLCFCGYLHMRVTTDDLLTESAHRLHVRLHVKHMHSFRGSTHRPL